jgi:hypothetical protein
MQEPLSKWHAVAKWMGLILLLWTLAAVWFYLDGSARLGTRVDLQTSRIKETSGKAYRYAPTKAELADQDRWLEARLIEDGHELPRNLITKERVALTGQGTYVLSPKNLWFSATDSSDPRGNGRRYQILLPKLVPAFIRDLIQRVWFCWLLAFVLLYWRREVAAGAKAAWTSNFWRAVIVISIARLVLIGYDEVVATISDQEDYTKLAAGWYYQTTPDLYFRLPVYPMFMAFCGLSGLPLRFMIEFAQLASYALLVGAMLRCGIARWVAFVTFAWMALLPQTGDWNNYTVSETLYVPAIIDVIAFGMLWLASGSWRYALACGVTMGLLMNLREERIIALAIVFLLLVFYAIQLWRNRAQTSSATGASPNLFAKFAPAIVPLVLATGVLDVGFQAAFKARTGLWGHCLVSTPGIVAFMNEVYRIPHDEPPQRYFLIDKKVRDTASTLSPIFRERQHFYENEEFGYLDGMLKETGTRDLAAGWFLWVPMLGNAFTDGKPNAVQYRDELMKKAAEEIRQGLAGHEQQTIFMGGTFPINSTALKVFFKDWRRLLAECRYVSFPPPLDGAYPPVGPTGEQTIQLYNHVANRRPALAKMVDQQQVTRPAWVRSVWTVIYQIQVGCLWLAGALLIATPLILLGRLLRRSIAWTPARAYAVAFLLLLSIAGLSRIAFNCLTGIYFIGGIQLRYMLAFTVISVPLVALALEAVTSRNAPAVGDSPAP